MRLLAPWLVAMALVTPAARAGGPLPPPFLSEAPPAPFELSSPLGFDLRSPAAPAGLHAEREVTPPGAPPDVVLEHVDLMLGGDVLVSVDVFANPFGFDVLEWLGSWMAYLADDETSVTLTAATARQAPAVRLDAPHTRHAFARAHALVAIEGFLVRINCENAEHIEAVELFEDVVATFDVAPEAAR